MKKRIITIFLAVSMICSLGGCVNGSQGGNRTNTEDDTDEYTDDVEKVETTEEATPTEDPAVIAQKEAEDKQARLDEQYGADYDKAVKFFEDNKYEEARALFSDMKDYKESSDYLYKIGSAIYDEMEEKYNESDIESAKEISALIDESSEWTGYNKTLSLLNEIESKRILEEGYTKEELPTGYFIKKGDRFFPIPDAREDGFFKGNNAEVLFIDADKYKDDMFMHMSKHDSFVYKGSNDRGLGFDFTGADPENCGYTYEVAIDTDGVVSIRDDKLLVDGKVSYVNDMEFYDWVDLMEGRWEEHKFYYAHNYGAFSNYYVFINNIPQGDVIKVGYFTDTSEYLEKEYEANLWAVSYKSYGYHSLGFEPTKEGYFEANLEYYNEHDYNITGLNWFKVANGDGHFFLLWID